MDRLQMMRHLLFLVPLILPILLAGCAVPDPYPKREAEDLFQRAQSLGGNNEDLAAIEDLKHAIALDPEFFYAWRLMGWYFYRNDRYGEAELAVRASLRLDPNDILAVWLYGVVTFKLGDHETAEYHLRRVVTRDDRDPFTEDLSAYQVLGHIAFDRANYDAAAAYYHRAVTLAPDKWNTWFDVAVSNHHLGDYQAAIQAYREALKRNTGHAESLYGLGWALGVRAIRRDQDFTEALAVAQRAVFAAPNFADNYRLLARAYEKNGQADKALVAFRRAVELDGTSPYYRLLLAQRLLALDTEEATREAERELIFGIALDPSFSTLSDRGPSLILTYFALLVREKRWRRAGALMAWARKEGVLSMAEACRCINNPECDCLRGGAQSIYRPPEDPAVTGRRDAKELIHIGNGSEVIGLLEAALQRQPNANEPTIILWRTSGLQANQRGLELLREDRYQEERHVFEEALDNFPTDASVRQIWQRAEDELQTLGLLKKLEADTAAEQEATRRIQLQVEDLVDSLRGGPVKLESEFGAVAPILDPGAFDFRSFDPNKPLVDAPEVRAVSRADAAAGYEALLEEDLGRALEMLTRAIGSGDMDNEWLVRALNNRGVVYRRLKRTDLAIGDYDRAMKIDPNFVIAISNRGLAGAKAGDYHKAILDFNKAESLGGGSTELYVRRASAYFDAGNYKKASRDFDQALALDGENVDAYAGSCDAKRRLGYRQDAITDCASAARLDPQNSLTRRMLRILRDPNADSLNWQCCMVEDR